MKDYITKPINITQLFLTLEKWIQPGDREVIPAKEPSKDTPAIQIPDIEGMDVKDGLKRIGGDPAAYLKVLRLFITRHGKFAQQVTHALKTNDQTTAARLVHTLKGVASNIGAFELFDNCRELERLLQNQEQTLPLIDEQLKNTDGTLQRVIAAITHALAGIKQPEPEKTGQDNTGQGNTGQLKKLISRLKTALTDYDTQSSDILCDIERMSGSAGFTQAVLEMRKSIDAYDYQKALEIIEEIKT